MADYVSVHSASALVHTGKGQVAGIVITAAAGNPKITIYDNTTNAGSKIFEAFVSVGQPLVLLFEDHFAIRFVTGCYIYIPVPGDPYTVVVDLWTRRL